MDQPKKQGRGRLFYLVSGIVLGSLITSFLASLAVERRDAVVVSSYQGLEGARSLQAEGAGHKLDAYSHQANMVAVMEQKKGALGLDLVPWSLWTPFSSIAQTLIIPTPNNSWSDAVLQVQKNRLVQLSK
ncbi:hypothetical protein [Ralstonia solanacearum]|uniref:Uncharacterized protein n=1 Tax=Ralstonia solanacearum TaxID=305 RepID=A0AAD0WGV6_RALSL|nr:hypothetical protein [Ralstonia solanacearum]AXV81377.1 hypothetical protein CJO77_07295 [Ralstonia solanacearum]